MQIALSPKDLAFREEVDAFLDKAMTADIRREAARQAGVFAAPDLARRWHRILFEQGWAAPAWPIEYGGPGWSITQRYLFEDSCARAGAPVRPAMGLQMCGPVLMRYGTAAQKDHFLPRILSGEHYWCQGYSEPQSGSDLVSLACRAVREGDHYVIDGSKIWTTHAHAADWMFLLVRTSSTGKPQAGISFLLIDMKTPGVSVRPIISMSGEHEVNQVFFDGARVPVANLVGAENDGWTVAKHLLEFERGGGAYAPRVRAMLGRIRTMSAEASGGDGLLLNDNRDFQRRLAELECRLLAVEAAEWRTIASAAKEGRGGDTSASVMKLAGSEALQAATELAIEALGVYAAPWQGEALYKGGNATPIGPDYALTPMARYLNARAATIYGGSSEIQRNILAKVALKL